MMTLAWATTFVPRAAVLVDHDGREVAVVPFTRHLDTVTVHGDAASTALRLNRAREGTELRRIFRMTNEVDQFGRPILREN